MLTDWNYPIVRINCESGLQHLLNVRLREDQRALNSNNLKTLKQKLLMLLWKVERLIVLQ